MVASVKLPLTDAVTSLLMSSGAHLAATDPTDATMTRHAHLHYAL
jgi:hypothetical protein